MSSSSSLSSSGFCRSGVGVVLLVLCIVAGDLSKQRRTSVSRIGCSRYTLTSKRYRLHQPYRHPNEYLLQAVSLVSSYYNSMHVFSILSSMLTPRYTYLKVSPVIVTRLRLGRTGSSNTGAAVDSLLMAGRRCRWRNTWVPLLVYPASSFLPHPLASLLVFSIAGLVLIDRRWFDLYRRSPCKEQCEFFRRTASLFLTFEAVAYCLTEHLLLTQARGAVVLPKVAFALVVPWSSSDGRFLVR